MSTLTPTCPARKPRCRSVRLERRPFGTRPGVLVITERLSGTRTTADRYTVSRLAADFGTAAFRVVKQGAFESDYDVLLDGPTSRCDCKGHERHGHCRHVESLQALVDAGQL